MPSGTKETRKIQTEASPRPKILVSSSVYGFEDLLESIYALLETYGFEVQMSHKGTIPINSADTAFDACLRAVENCDLFLGIILPRYGSGIDQKTGLSITHREAVLAIELNKPRWFLVHEHVAIARQVLQPYRDDGVQERFVLKSGLVFGKTKILDDPRIIDLYEAAMRHEIRKVADRKGNWVQTFGTDEDARLFATAQFRRHRDILDKHLPKLKPLAERIAQQGPKKEGG